MADQCFPMASLDVTWAQRFWDDTLSCKKEKAKRRRSDVSHAWCPALAGLGQGSPFEICIDNCFIERTLHTRLATHASVDAPVAGDAFELERQKPRKRYEIIPKLTRTTV